MRLAAAGIGRLPGDESGLAALEFALIAPFLLVLLLGGFEVSRFILVQQKVEKMAYSVADVTAQFDEDDFDQDDMNLALSATSQIMQPYTFADDGLAIVSSVYKEPEDETAMVRWQCQTESPLPNTSMVGSPNGEATLPGNVLIDDRDNVIVAEVYYRFTPVFTTVFIQPFTIHRTAMFRPRIGQLTNSPGC